MTDEAARLYLVLGRLNRALRRQARDVAVGHGALSALSTLTRQGPQRLGTLAATEGVSPPSMTRIVASLETLGHVRRAADPEDGRAWIVAATDTGTQVVLAGRQGRMVELERRIALLPDTDRRLLDAALPVLERLAGLEDPGPDETQDRGRSPLR